MKKQKNVKIEKYKYFVSEYEFDTVEDMTDETFRQILENFKEGDVLTGRAVAPLFNSVPFLESGAICDDFFYIDEIDTVFLRVSISHYMKTSADAIPADGYRPISRGEYKRMKE